MKPPIFLDWDGVLIDSADLYFNLFRDVCRQQGKDFPVPDLQTFRDWYKPNWEVNFFELGFTNEEYMEFCLTYPDTLDYAEASFFEGVPEMVSNLADSHPLVVVSTAPTRNIQEHLRAAGLLQKFHSVTGSDDGSTGKVARLAAHLAELETGSGVMVGDTDLDILAGKANKLITVGVTYGWISAERVKEAEPDYLVNHPEELPDAVKDAARACITVDDVEELIE